MSDFYNMPQLQELAHAYGIETAYYDITQRRQETSPESLLLVLRALGAPVETFGDVSAALIEHRQAVWRRCLEPVVVVWDGDSAEVELRLLVDQAVGSAMCHMELENGEARGWACDISGLPTTQTVEVEGERYVAKKLPIPGRLPWGYHRLIVESSGRLSEAMIICAPVKAYLPPESSVSRVWGVFLPLYALHSRRSWGSGDFSDLGNLITWLTGQGGSVVATLPFLASFLDESFDPSPYAPVSRLFWNEFYIDVTKVTELKNCAAARAMLESGEVKEAVEKLQSLPLVDYRHQMALKRRLLEELAKCFFTKPADHLAAFRHFMETNHRVEDYARFRATCERRSVPWPEWPQRLCAGILKEGDYSEDTKRYHAYVQWVAHQQLETLSEKAREKGSGLYLDFPLGVNPDGYDMWREHSLFTMGVSVGAPPDTLFSGGQDWGFTPLHPEKIREQEHRYFIACLNHQLEYASILRIDHVMGLHRLFWIPEGMEPSKGVYVRYAADELYAILSLESHRHKCLLVGENLGTVPPYVNEAMTRHNIQCMYVTQYEITPDSNGTLREVPTNAVASLNTHDMPPFSAFWQGLDIEDRLAMKILDTTGAHVERGSRQNLKQALVNFLQRNGWLKGNSWDTHSVLRACLAFLASSHARILLVNLEDLWLETEPQNVPGIQEEHPNWRRKARYSLEVLSQMPEVLDAVEEIDRIFKRGKGF